ncbi:MAG: hypothetical protein IPP77_06895 [Bacteroidetes bacterium]|nr:hypothetical protein [Bacteroidota bacterium]
MYSSIENSFAQMLFSTNKHSFSPSETPVTAGAGLSSLTLNYLYEITMCKSAVYSKNRTDKSFTGADKSSNRKLYSFIHADNSINRTDNTSSRADNSFNRTDNSINCTVNTSNRADKWKNRRPFLSFGPLLIKNHTQTGVIGQFSSSSLSLISII